MRRAAAKPVKKIGRITLFLVDQALMAEHATKRTHRVVATADVVGPPFPQPAARQPGLGRAPGSAKAGVGFRAPVSVCTICAELREQAGCRDQVIRFARAELPFGAAEDSDRPVARNVF